MSVDLVASYQLLLCVLDYSYENALQEELVKKIEYEGIGGSLKLLCNRFVAMLEWIYQLQVAA